MKDAKKIFSEGMVGLAEIHDKTLTDALKKIYWEILKGFPAEELHRGFARAVEETKFFPKPEELLELIQGSRAEKALVAWGKLVKAIEEHGRTKSVAFDDPAIHAVVHEMGGWGKVCAWEQSELPFRRQEFERWYAVAARRSDHPAYLVGEYEADNWHWRDDPLRGRLVRGNCAVRLVGDAGQALALMETAKAKQLTSREVRQIEGVNP